MRQSTPIPRGPEPEYERVVSGYETFHHGEPFRFEWSGRLSEMDIAYETWGTLSPARDNAILVHTGLSASSHARSQAKNPHRGWWEDFIGPGAPLDTNRFFVICSNLLGGCYGSTGPASTNPETGLPYGSEFPILTVRDMVRAQILLLDHLEIDRLYAAVGASLGGMQSPMLAALAPERVERMVSISAAACSHPQSIAMRFVQRQAVMADPDWREGQYYGQSFPHRGLRVAREIGTLTYRSGPEWMERFGRQRIKDEAPRLDEDFQVEGYLAYQGDKFCLQYDPNSYLYISKAMDLFDMTDRQAAQANHPEDSPARLADVQCPSLIVGVTTDLLFPVWQQQELAELLRGHGTPVEYLELDSPYGHDSFLIEQEKLGVPLSRFLSR
ncbi:homoserine O-acetyltransferase [Myxococcota bacterium]|nr:homoserine O-acetyltransferase [Myxococcota bacterium]